MSDVETNDLALLARAGDIGAYSELARRFRPRLLAALCKRLGSLADAEDVAQESLTKAWQHIATFDDQFPFSSWLYTIAFRQATDCQRSIRRRENLARRVKPVEETASESESSLMKQELSNNIWSTARKILTTPQYLALWLRYVEDLSVREIARTMGKTSVGVRVILHRGRTVLQRHLVDFSDDGGSK